MNMPVSGDNTVLFRTTLFALVRTSMSMTPKDKGCFRDNNFRRIIRKLWPNTTQRMLDVILPEQSSTWVRSHVFSIIFILLKEVFSSQAKSKTVLINNPYARVK